MIHLPVLKKSELAAAESMMALALRLARRAMKKTWPNPMVGAVVAKGDRVLGSGYHHRPGWPHAEVEALSRCGRSARGADLYVTLEPCHCHGRTGPCSAVIEAAGIRRVFVGAMDPNPCECGQGLADLQRRGIQIFTGILEDQCRTLNEAYNVFITKKRPFVVLKAAISLDGRIATSTGDSKWISGESSRRRAHQLRALSNAVLVGRGTVASDDPALTVRWVKGPNPGVVVLDSHLSISLKSKLLRVPRGAPIWIFCSMRADPRRIQALRGKGVDVVPIPGRGGRLELRKVLRELYRRGVYQLLVEGGAAVMGSFFADRVVDRLELHLAPRLLGSEGQPLMQWQGPTSIRHAPHLTNVRWMRRGQDGCCSGLVVWPTKHGAEHVHRHR